MENMGIDTKELWAAREARRVAAAYYLNNPRVRLIDVGWKERNGKRTDELSVRIHVTNKPTEAAFESFSMENEALLINPKKIPFTVDFIKANYRLHDYWWADSYTPVSERARCCNPLCGGISISNERTYEYGTLGGIVSDRDTGDPMILSNWHVLAGTFYAPKGQKIYQPGIGDGGCSSDVVATLERDAMMDGIDAAVAKLSTDRSWVNNQFKLGAVNGAEVPRLGMHVVKSGRRSEVTYGVIDGMDGEYPIWYGGLQRCIKHVYRIVPQPGQTEVSEGGDSGSWWLNQTTSRAVGLHFAGMDDPETALAISMPEVLQALNITIMV
jgi:hypothetical protein